MGRALASIEERRERCRQMYLDGMSPAPIANRLSLKVTTVLKWIEDLPDRSVLRASKGVRKSVEMTGELRNPWLDETDEANVRGYWVPSPEEIAEKVEAIRAGRLVILQGSRSVEVFEVKP